jgi:carbon starvation protein
MSALLILVVSIALFIIAYIFYGAWLAKQWGVDNSRPTPAHTMTDGIDYVPARTPVLLGHHFASIAGAGPINGPILAAVFGWVPVLLWVVIGGIFFGAVHDFASLFSSIRHGGHSIGQVIQVNIGKQGKRLFLVFAWLTLMLVVAAFADIVASTFMGFNAEGAPVPANGSTAMASVLFLVISVLFGFFVYRRNAPLSIASVIGVILLICCIAIGINVPIFLPKTAWLGLIFIYIFVASVTPVWILLQPRDYLNSFLLYGTILAAVLGILISNPTMNLPAFSGFTVNGSWLFPMLFITVACGAISGFHSLVGSGTTAKQLNTEKDAKIIGYGGMLIECALAVIALIAVGALYANGAMPQGTPPIVFANGIATFTAAFGVPPTVAYTVVTLAISAFALTSLDTATRLARYIFQEFFTPEEEGAKITGARKLLTNMYFATLIGVVCGGLLAVGGYANIWPLFGSANQLLAGLALLAAAVWLGNMGKNNKMFYIPMAFMLIATLTALAITFNKNLGLLTAGTGAFYKEGLQCVFAAILFVLAVILSIQGLKVLFGKKKAEAEQAA